MKKCDSALFKAHRRYIYNYMLHLSISYFYFFTNFEPLSSQSFSKDLTEQGLALFPQLILAPSSQYQYLVLEKDAKLKDKRTKNNNFFI